MVMKPSWPWWVEVRLLQLSMLLLCCQYKCIRCKCWKKHLFHWHLEAFETGFIEKKKSRNKWTVVIKTKFFKMWSCCVCWSWPICSWWTFFLNESGVCVRVCVICSFFLQYLPSPRGSCTVKLSREDRKQKRFVCDSLDCASSFLGSSLVWDGTASSARAV